MILLGINAFNYGFGQILSRVPVIRAAVCKLGVPLLTFFAVEYIF